MHQFTIFSKDDQLKLLRETILNLHRKLKSKLKILDNLLNIKRWEPVLHDRSIFPLTEVKT